MKKILLSLGMIALVAGIVWGVTGAFYNDEETSTGNIFVAGSIDLKVDHLKQTYNGDDCETCSLTLYSGDGGAKVVAGENTVLNVFPFPAVLVTPTPITEQYWTTHPIAEWIWASPATLVGDDGSEGQITYTFEHDFQWWGEAVDVDLVFDVAADNQYQILLNDVVIATGVGSAQYTTLDPVVEATFLGQVVPGQNTLTFIVTNLVNTPGNNTPLNNPGGLLYHLKVERDPEDCNSNTEFQNACRLWVEKDLEEGDSFFNFGDIKPGDEGTNVISLHVYDNDAYACLIVHNKDDQENGIQESEDGDLPNQGNPSGFGELSNYLDVFTWSDNNQNGEYDNGETSIGGPAPLASFGSIMSLDPSNQGFLTATTTKYVGVAWCAGNLTLEEGELVCDGSGMENDAQSDSFSASLTAYAVQTRNNPNFSCADIADDYNSPEDEDEPVLQLKPVAPAQPNI